MTIRPGQDWGSPATLDRSCPVATSDRDLAAHVQRHLDLGDAVPEIGLVAGDLHRTLGSPGRDAEALFRGEGVRYPIDVGVVHLEGRREVFVAHLVLFGDRRMRWWATRTVAVMNAQFLGNLDLAPRGHPNDGRLDVTDGSLPSVDRRRAARRMPNGSHVPHPALRQRRVRDLELHDESPMSLLIDGERRPDVFALRVECIADAVCVVA